jgi:ribosomal protein L37AE/L43A
MPSSARGLRHNARMGEESVAGGPQCPSCGEPWLRGTNLAARYRCVYCLHRFELRSECPNCGAHSTIARMSDTANVTCRNCGGSMLQAI